MFRVLVSVVVHGQDMANTSLGGVQCGRVAFAITRCGRVRVIITTMRMIGVIIRSTLCDSCTATCGGVVCVVRAAAKHRVHGKANERQNVQNVSKHDVNVMATECDLS